MTRPRPALLWVWRDLPSRLGTGSQQRAAHLFLALADHFDIHVLVIPARQSLPGAPDNALLSRFASFEQLATEKSAANEAADPGADGLSSAGAGRIAEHVVATARRRGVDATLIVTFELAVFLRSVLEQLEPVFLELDELMSRRQQRFLATPGLSRDKEAEFGRGLRLMGLLEQQMLPRFRGIIVSSAVEEANLAGRVPGDHVSFVPNATHRKAVLPPPPQSAVRSLLFVGRMDYFPNLDATRFFVAEVWPLLRARHGHAVRLHLVGFGAPASFRPEATEGVIFDRDRSDIVPAYRDASVAIVPLRSGGGTRVKILEAFALGRPVVSTAMGAEGLDVENGRHLMIADTPAAFAAACSRLLGDADMVARLVAESAAWVQRHHSTDAVKAAVADSVLVRSFLP